MIDLDDRILIAIPKKGRLNKASLEYLKRIGIKFHKKDRFDIALCSQTPLALIFLPAKDIPLYVSHGKVSYGITGQDMVRERNASVDEVLELGFGKCKLCIAGPKTKNYEVKDLVGKSVATSFPLLTENYFKNKVKTENFSIIVISGSVEITPTLGTSDVIVDLVESGSTLKESGLKVIDTIIHTQAVLIARKNLNDFEKTWLKKIKTRFEGVIAAEKFLMIDYNIHKKNLVKAEKITPGMSSPTIMSLEKENWVAVRSVILEKDMHIIIEKLNEQGAEAILVSNMQYFQMR